MQAELEVGVRGVVDRKHMRSRLLGYVRWGQSGAETWSVDDQYLWQGRIVDKA